MSNRIIVLTVALAIAGCGEKSGVETKQATEATGRGFKVPVPKGYAIVTDKRMQQIVDQGGVALVTKSPPQGMFVPSFVILPLPDGISAVDVSNVDVCRAQVSFIEGATGARLTKVEVAQLSFGQACRYSLQDEKDANRIAKGVLVSRAPSSWFITCNYDKRDRRAGKACKQVVAGFEFTN